MRSPNYPAVGLSEAVNLAQLVWNKEKRSYAPQNTLVQAWGYSGLSGNARTKIAALRKYELLEDNADGDLRLSELAIHILHNPNDSNERLIALREAALKPELFAELQQTHPDASDESLRSILMTRKGFSDTGADACIKALRDTQEIAKLSTMQPAATPHTPHSSLTPPPPSVDTQSEAARALAEKAAKKLAEREIEQSTFFRWPLSRGVTAEVRFNGNIKPAHLDLLKKYLDVAKGAMELEEEQPDDVPLDRQMD